MISQGTKVVVEGNDILTEKDRQVMSFQLPVFLLASLISNHYFSPCRVGDDEHFFLLFLRIGRNLSAVVTPEGNLLKVLTGAALQIKMILWTYIETWRHF